MTVSQDISGDPIQTPAPETALPSHGRAGADSSLRAGALADSQAGPRAGTLARSAAVFSGLVLSQASEFARDVVMAARFGASQISDGFFCAYAPLFLVVTTLTVACPVVLVPAFTLCRASAAERFRELVGLFTLILLGAAVGGYFFSHEITTLVAPGLDPATRELSAGFMARLVWIWLPLGFIAVTAAFLRSRNQFFVPAALKFSGNACFMGTLLCLAADAAAADALVAAVFSLYAAQAGYLLFFLAKTGGVPVFRRWLPSKRTWRTMALFAFPVASIFLSQLVVMSERFFSSLLDPGNLSLVAYTGRLYTGGANLLGGTLMGAALPVLAAMAGAGRIHRMRRQVWEQMKLAVLACLPVSLFVLVFARDIIRILFGNAFTDAQVMVSGQVLALYFAGLLFGVVIPLFTALFSALGRFRLILLVSLTFVSVNVLFNHLFIGRLGIYSLPLARCCANFFAAVLSLFLAHRELGTGERTRP